MKKTDWFDGNVKPVRVGVYERNWESTSPIFSKWDGEKWLICWESINEAEKEYRPSAFPFDQWRGLASDPKGKK